jgi:membrane protein YdbS with pleckstrin-like domain
MRYLIALAFIASVTSIICGYTLEVDYAQKLIGFGVVGLFFVVIPLFTYHRWKNRDAKEYMLTKEKLEEMRKKEGDTRKL